MSGKNLVLELCPKMLSANQIAEFFKLEYPWNRMTYQPNFLHVKSYQLWLEVDQFSLSKYAYIKSWAWSGIQIARMFVGNSLELLVGNSLKIKYLFKNTLSSVPRVTSPLDLVGWPLIVTYCYPHNPFDPFDLSIMGKSKCIVS